MKIIITNLVTSNPGDAAILFGTVRVLRNAFGENAKYVVYDRDPEIARQYGFSVELRKPLYPGLRELERRAPRTLRKLLRIRFWLGVLSWKEGAEWLARWLLTEEEIRVVKDYASAGCVISAGGTYLVEWYDLSGRFFDFMLVKRLGKPLVLHTQSLGPFRRRESRASIRRALNSARLILVRDEESRRHLEDAKVRAAVRVSADAAFALIEKERLERIWASDPVDQGIVAISVREWRHFTKCTPEKGMQKYRDAVADLITHVVTKMNCSVLFVSTCQGVPRYWTDDSRVAREIVQLLDKRLHDRVIVDSIWRSPLAIVDLLERVDLVVATRMHMAILALLAGKPVLPIAYEFKTVALFRRLGLEGYVRYMDDVSARGLTEAFDRVWSERKHIRRALGNKVIAEHKEAFRAGRRIRRLMRGS